MLWWSSVGGMKNGNFHGDWMQAAQKPEAPLALILSGKIAGRRLTYTRSPLSQITRNQRDNHA